IELCWPTPSKGDPATWCDPSSSEGVTVVAADPTNGSVVYAGTRGHGLFKSGDGGRSWTLAGAGLPTYYSGGGAGCCAPTALYVDPKNPKIVLVGVLSTGIYRSADGGRTFKAAMSG